MSMAEDFSQLSDEDLAAELERARAGAQGAGGQPAAAPEDGYRGRSGEAMPAGYEAADIPWGEIVGRFALGQGVFMGGGDEAEAKLRSMKNGTEYDTELQTVRDEIAATRAKHPYLAGLFEALGAIVMPGGAAARAAGMGAKMLKGGMVGAGTGAGYGFGTAEGGEGTLAEQAKRRGTEAVFGGGVGLAAGAGVPLVGGIGGAAAKGAKAGYNKLMGGGRAVMAPEGQAGREVIESIASDRALGDEIGQEMLTPQRVAEARQRGQPTLPIDLGGDTTRDLARAAGDVSGRSRQIMKHKINKRYEQQVDRTIAYIHRLTGARPTQEVLEKLLVKARKANKKAYDKAYEEGAVVWDEQLQALTASPSVQKAIKTATTAGKDWSVLYGHTPPKNPFQFDEQGLMTLKTNPDGSTMLPSLQFWDIVKQELDGMAGVAYGKSNKQLGNRVTGLKNQLKDLLDENVPSYKTARGTAESFFGEENALAAGAAFVRKKMDNDAARKAIAKMTPEEKNLFREGFAAKLMAEVNEIGDRQDVMNSVFVKSRAARERIDIAMGTTRAQSFEAFVRVEKLMDLAREATQGNSKTTQFLATLAGQGAIGGAATSYLAGYTDPMQLFINVITGAGLNASRLAARRKVAEAVAKKLMDPNLDISDQAIRRISQNKMMMEALRRFESAFVKVAAQQASTRLGAEDVGMGVGGA